MDEKAPSTAITSKGAGHHLPFMMWILISIFVANNVFYTILLSGTSQSELSSSWGVALFSLLGIAAYGVGWHILSRFVNKIDVGVRAKSRYFNRMYKAVRIVFYVSAGILAVIIFQIALFSKYNVILSLAAMDISNILAAIIMAILAYKFLSWYIPKHDFAVLLFGLAFAMTVIGVGMMTIANTVAFLIDGPPLREESSNSVQDFARVSTTSTRSELFQITLMPYRLTFGLYWVGTVLLLRQYSKSFGRLKFWAMVSMPLVFFTISNIFFSTSHYANSLFFDVIVALAEPPVGILYAVTFFTMAKNMKRTGRNTSAAHYLIISGYGVILILATTSSSPHFVDYEQTPYPPFATAPWSFLAFAAYLFSVGYYFSAISISSDIELRKTIQQFASSSQSKFLNDIGSAQMEQEITHIVAQLAKKAEESLREQAGVGQSLEGDNLKQYVDWAIEEVKGSRKQ